MRSTSSSVVLFDGVCNLCSGAVQWILARDPEGRFQFASLQSAAASRVLAPFTTDEPLPDSLVLVDHDGLHLRSDAALRIAGGLGGVWVLLSLARVVPRPIRDAVYRWVARHRYRWFGREAHCFLPSPEYAGRFLDAGEGL